MFLQLAHTKLEIFQITKRLVLETYRISKLLPQDEKFALTQQIRRAVISVHLNVAEGFSRKSKAERKRFLVVSRGSLIELDTALDISIELLYLEGENLNAVSMSIISCFSQLSKLIKSLG
jgi:four helix bundle protein